MTLDDGREVLIDITGKRDAGSDGQGRAVVTLVLSDSAITLMSPDEIHARLRLLSDIRWSARWNDETLLAAANTKALLAAQEAIDGWEGAKEAQL